MKKYIFALLLSVLTFSCTKALYDYKDYDDAAYTYAARESDSDVKNIAKSYQSIVGEKEQKRKSSKFDPYRIPPGACADYGYLLLRQKDSLGARQWFDKEIELYPESEKYINHLKERYGL